MEHTTNVLQSYDFPINKIKSCGYFTASSRFTWGPISSTELPVVTLECHATVHSIWLTVCLCIVTFLTHGLATLRCFSTVVCAHPLDSPQQDEWKQWKGSGKG